MELQHPVEDDSSRSGNLPVVACFLTVEFVKTCSSDVRSEVRTEQCNHLATGTTFTDFAPSPARDRDTLVRYAFHWRLDYVFEIPPLPLLTPVMDGTIIIEELGLLGWSYPFVSPSDEGVGLIRSSRDPVCPGLPVFRETH